MFHTERIITRINNNNNNRVEVNRLSSTMALVEEERRTRSFLQYHFLVYSRVRFHRTLSLSLSLPSFFFLNKKVSSPLIFFSSFFSIKDIPIGTNKSSMNAFFHVFSRHGHNKTPRSEGGGEIF